MVNSIQIQNFKCHRRLFVDKLSAFTLIGGKNSAGKTAFLEAIHLFYDRGNPNTIVDQYKQRGWWSIDSRTEVAITPLFLMGMLNIPISIHVDDERGSESLVIHWRAGWHAPQAAPMDGERWSSGQGQARSADGALQFNYTKDGGQCYLAFDPSRGPQLTTIRPASVASSAALMGQYYAPRILEFFEQVERENRTDEVVHLLQLFEPSITDLAVLTVGGMPEVHAGLKTMRSKQPVGLLGAGTVRCLEYALAIISSRDGVVLIDEIENGIHTSLQKPLIRVLHQMAGNCGCQIIATTHSSEFLLNAVEVFRDKPHEYSFARLERGSEGDTRAVTMDLEALETLTSTGLEVR